MFRNDANRQLETINRLKVLVMQATDKVRKLEEEFMNYQSYDDIDDNNSV